jgi:hypothetical protein
MKTVGLAFLLLSFLPLSATAQSASAELRTRLEEARKERQSRQEAIEMESSLMKSSQEALRAPAVTARSAAPRLHPAHLSLPGRVITTVMRSALAGPELVPLSLPRPEVVELVPAERASIPTKEPGVL